MVNQKSKVLQETLWFLCFTLWNALSPSSFTHDKIIREMRKNVYQAEQKLINLLRFAKYTKQTLVSFSKKQQLLLK